MVKIDISDISTQNKPMANGAALSWDIDKHVDDWIAAHQAEFDSWVADAAAAKWSLPDRPPGPSFGAALSHIGGPP